MSTKLRRGLIHGRARRVITVPAILDTFRRGPVYSPAMSSHSQSKSPAPTAAPEPASSTRPTAGGSNSARAEALAARLPAPIPAVGSLDYYALRHADFADRHAASGSSPPDYYLGYGDKYVRRFSHEVAPLLSAAGQTWLVDVRQRLQVAIESERERDPAAFDTLELDGAAFRSFAFDTHPECYWAAGLGELPLADLLTIGLTPDTPDLLSFDGLGQVADIAGRLLGAWGSEALDVVLWDGAADRLVQHAYAGLLVVGDGINHIFGDGASETLRGAASAVGATVESLAQDIHGAIAGALTVGRDAHDRIWGDGATDEALGQARMAAQQGVERVEDGFEWLQGLADSLAPSARS
ncbi:MAG: hypothetical protein CL927_08430 [Deltaproteobacteria bacterium]|nr:hypothetical protein [Deltaproteobacteria bacterium]HCH62665.1 hypothetical protein [Deltaproteobacteria bacterium]